MSDHPYLGRTFRYTGPAWLVDDAQLLQFARCIEFQYDGWLDIEEFDSSERGSFVVCWVHGYEQENDKPDRGWVFIDALPDVIEWKDSILSDVEAVKREIFDARMEFEDWYYERIQWKLEALVNP